MSQWSVKTQAMEPNWRAQTQEGSTGVPCDFSLTLPHYSEWPVGQTEGRLGWKLKGTEVDYRDVPAEETDRSVISPFAADGLKQRHCRTWFSLWRGNLSWHKCEDKVVGAQQACAWMLDITRLKFLIDYWSPFKGNIILILHVTFPLKLTLCWANRYCVRGRSQHIYVAAVINRGICSLYDVTNGSKLHLRFVIS